MAWGSVKDFGILKPDGKSLRLYSTNTSYSVINVGLEIKEARWVGEDLVVYLANGKVRKYKSQTSYSTIN
jgi:hypothetical protein